MCIRDSGDTVRTITAWDVQRRGDDIDITVTADGYLYNMVRILAGTPVSYTHLSCISCCSLRRPTRWALRFR